MRYLFYILFLILVSSFNDPLPKDHITYWESRGKAPILGQIIVSHDDQGRHVLHINLYLSKSCTTKMYYAMPIDDDNHYVLTNTGGKVVDESAHLVIKKQKKLKLDNTLFVRISPEKYFADMKKFEKIKQKNDAPRK